MTPKTAAGILTAIGIAISALITAAIDPIAAYLQPRFGAVPIVSACLLIFAILLWFAARSDKRRC
jgi:hypothetical protein